MPQDMPEGKPSGSERLRGVQQQHPAQHVSQEEFIRGDLMRPDVHHLRGSQGPAQDVEAVYYSPHQKSPAPCLAHAHPLRVFKNQERAKQGDSDSTSEQKRRNNLVEDIGRNVLREPQTEQHAGRADNDEALFHRTNVQNLRLKEKCPVPKIIRKYPSPIIHIRPQITPQTVYFKTLSSNFQLVLSRAANLSA